MVTFTPPFLIFFYCYLVKGFKEKSFLFKKKLPFVLEKKTAHEDSLTFSRNEGKKRVQMFSKVEHSIRYVLKLTLKRP